MHFHSTTPRNQRPVNPALPRAAALMAVAALLGAPACAGSAASNWNAASEVLAIGLPLAAAGYSYAVQDTEGLQQLGWSVGSAYLATKLIKTAIPVHRPDGSGNDSFPSGHATVAFAAARAMDVRYGGHYNAWLYGAAVATGVARVQSGQHRWGDVVAGGLVGWSASHWLATPLARQQGFKSSQLSLLPAAHGLSVYLSVSW